VQAVTNINLNEAGGSSGSAKPTTFFQAAKPASRASFL
jgi:hypothetical protein